MDFSLFYIVIAFYILISLTFITYSCFFGPTLIKRIKLFFMIDNILICMVSTNVAYAYLHIASFTTTYETDYNYVIQTKNEIYAVDITCIILYCFTNFTMTGIFRILMVYIDWKPCEVVIYKLGIVGSSLIYLIVAFVYYSGKDEVNNQIEAFKQGIVNLI